MRNLESLREIVKKVGDGSKGFSIGGQGYYSIWVGMLSSEEIQVDKGMYI